MGLPSHVHLSQGSLQDYVDCPRRFQLRYVRRLQWPAVETEPALKNEAHLRQGAALHRMIRQHLMGIPAATLSSTVDDPELRQWWQNYLKEGPAGLPDERYPEVMLSAVVGESRLVARYDLIAIGGDGRAVIVDWKTNRKRPRRAWLSARLQSRVYPYVLVRAGSVLGSRRAPQPDDVTMIYWFANFPSAPETYRYDARQYRADERYLLDLVDEIGKAIASCPKDQLLPPTDDDRHCEVCRYRSLCRRGVEPGWLDDPEREMRLDDSFGDTLDFEQIAELDMG